MAVTSVPMMFPCTTFVLPQRPTPLMPFAEMTFPAPTAVPPIVVLCAGLLLLIFTP